MIKEKNNTEKNEKCPCFAICPLSRAMNKLGGKWKLRLLCTLLQDGPARYNTLKRKTVGITNTMLASSLKELERDGLILRQEYLEVPVRVEYRVTEACKSLAPVLEQLAKWELTVFSAE